MKTFILLLLFAALPLFSQGTQSDTVWTKHIFPDEIVEAMFTKDGSNIIVAAKDKLLVYQTETGEKIHEISLKELNYDSQVADLDISPDGSQFVIATLNGRIIIFNTFTLDTIKTYHLMQQIGDNIKYSRDGKKLLIITSEQIAEFVNYIAVYDIETNDTIRIHDDGLICRICVSENSNYFIAYSETTYHRVKLWDAETYTEICELGQHDNDIWDLDFSPDGKYAASAAWDGKVKVWDIEQRKLLKNLEHQYKHNLVTQCSFSRDSKYIISSGGGIDYNIISIWNVSSWEITYIYPNPYGAAISLDIHNTNNYILSGGGYNLYLLNAKWEPISVKENNIIEKNILYPNPTDNVVTIEFIVNSPEIIQIKIIDEHGNLIEILQNGLQEAGQHSLKWNASGFASGIYFCKIEGRNINKIFKINVNK